VGNYINATSVVIDGEELKHVKKVREGKRTVRKAIKLMRRRGTVRVTPDNTVELECLIPEDEPEYDYATIADKTLTLEYENGTKVIYTEVSVIEVGDEEYDDDNEAVRKILLHSVGERQQV
jgi:hypothetical protein